jgi:hypothetical protein
MALYLHHVFVCVSANAPEADALITAGFVEGSGNVHAGQGTANRRFFFQRGFLELLWVHNDEEAQSDLSAPTRLWDRFTQIDHANRFGLCFASDSQTLDASGFAFPTRRYQPDYLSGDQHILFADALSLAEPEVFLLSWPQHQSVRASEPRDHPLGLRELRAVSIGLRDIRDASPTLQALRDLKLLALHRSAQPELQLQFSSTTNVDYRFPELALQIIGRVAVDCDNV